MTGLREPAVIVNWSDEEWAWHPKRGRFAPEFGPPPHNARISITTRSLDPRERYDFWRESVLYNFEADRRPAPDHDFYGTVHGLISPQGECFVMETSSLRGRRTNAQIAASSTAEVDIGLVLRGNRQVEYHDSTRAEEQSGGFFAFDTARPLEMSLSDYASIHLSFHRAELRDMLGSELPHPEELAAAVRRSALAPMLRSQLTLLAETLPHLNDYECYLAFGALKELICGILRSQLVNESADVYSRKQLFVSATRYIATNLSHPELGASVLAKALSCSRATLYRAFSDHGVTVSTYIREQRLLAMRQLLKSAPASLPIAEVAARCGFYDAPNISRLFRNRYGVSPSAMRRL